MAASVQEDETWLSALSHTSGLSETSENQQDGVTGPTWSKALWLSFNQ